MAKIEQGFILAAGFGSRMMPLTSDRPKPMIEIDGKPMVDHVLDGFAEHGLKKVIVNAHYKAEVLENHLKTRKTPETIISFETEILETGGGIVHALPLMKKADFFISAGDSFLEEGEGQSAMKRLESAWNPAIMDILVLLQPVEKMHLTQGVGDYHLGQDGRITRAHDQNGAYMFTGLRINAPHIFKDAPRGSFSYLKLLDEAQSRGRLFGLAHEGAWHHISTPVDVRALNDAMAAQNRVKI